MKQMTPKVSDGPSLTLIPILESTFVDPLLPPHPPETPEEFDIRDQSKIAGAKSLTAWTGYMCSLEREVFGRVVELYRLSIKPPR